jgi:hypothetical protein
MHKLLLQGFVCKTLPHPFVRWISVFIPRQYIRPGGKSKLGRSIHLTGDCGRAGK